MEDLKDSLQQQSPGTIKLDGSRAKNPVTSFPGSTFFLIEPVGLPAFQEVKAPQSYSRDR